MNILTLSLTSVISTAKQEKDYISSIFQIVVRKCISLPVNEQTPSRLGSP